MKVYRLRLHVRAPILTQSTAIGAVGIDSPVARDVDGTPYVAGSHVSGKMRQALLELRCAARAVDRDQPVFAPDVETWFGREDPGHGQERKAVLISDLHAIETRPRRFLQLARATPERRTRVAIDDVSGASLEGALQTLEMAFPAGTVVVFEGKVRILAPDAKAQIIAADLERGLNWILQLGGQRTVGFGRLHEVEWNPVRSRAPQVLPLPRDDKPIAERWRLILRFLEPFCIARPHRQGNLFESEEIVPGGVIMGGLVAQMAAEAGHRRGTRARNLGGEFPLLARHFSALRMSHMFPARLAALAGRDWLDDEEGTLRAVIAAGRPAAPPLSLVRDGKGRLFDVASCQGPGLLDGRAPSFAVDWKGSGDAWERFGWSSPGTTLRVRTAMDFDKRAAKAEQLFAYEMIVPDDHVWIGELDLQGVDDAAERLELLRELAGLVRDGLAGIGKTLATAQVLLAPLEEATAEMPKRRRDVRIVTLQTPALLCTPDDMRGATDNKSPGAAKRLLDGYRTTFEQLSGGALHLVRFFADQRLAGGQHYAARFMAGRAYQPWILTQPGSVFVLKVAVGRKEQHAEAVLQAWARQGLPVAQRIWSAYAPPPPDGETQGPAPPELERMFEVCPFIPENGYGEVALDLPQHDDLAPGARFKALTESEAA